MNSLRCRIERQHCEQSGNERRSGIQGVDVFLASDGLSKMIKTKYHTIPDAVNALGSIASIQSGFLELQKNVYAT